MRLTLATLVFVAAIAISRRFRARGRAATTRCARPSPTSRRAATTRSPSSAPRRSSRRDWLLLGVLGFIGHFMYQAFFIEGLARTSVANASLLIGCTPMAVSLANAALGLERLNKMHWIGTALSLAGIYVVVGRANGAGGASLTGDVIMAIAVWCWVCYTLMGKELLRRHSPLIVTGYSMAIGAVFYLIFSARDVWNTDWARITTGDWLGIALRHAAVVQRGLYPVVRGRPAPRQRAHGALFQPGADRLADRRRPVARRSDRLDESGGGLRRADRSGPTRVRLPASGDDRPALG